MQAREVLKVMPKGRYVMIKGSPVDPNADFLRGGQQEVLQAAIDAGDITIVGEAYTDDWQPANAQKNMEQILTETGIPAMPCAVSAATTPPAVPSFEATTASTLLSLAVRICSMFF